MWPVDCEVCGMSRLGPFKMHLRYQHYTELKEQQRPRSTAYLDHESSFGGCKLQDCFSMVSSGNRKSGKHVLDLKPCSRVCCALYVASSGRTIRGSKGNLESSMKERKHKGGLRTHEDSQHLRTGDKPVGDHKTRSVAIGKTRATNWGVYTKSILALLFINIGADQWLVTVHARPPIPPAQTAISVYRP